jgi:hypothetical protein
LAYPMVAVGMEAGTPWHREAPEKGLPFSPLSLSFQGPARQASFSCSLVPWKLLALKAFASR